MTSPNASLTTVVATYRVQSDLLDDFMALLDEHHPALADAGLVAEDSSPIVYRGAERGGGPIVFEIFTWASPEASAEAHRTPSIAKIWESMGEMCEARDGKPMFDFPHVERVRG